MKMSKRDIRVLIIVGSILIGVLYYQFGYTKLTENMNQKRKEKAQIETKYNEAMSDIETLGERKSNVKVLTTKDADKASGFYPKIVQEKLILEINKLMEDNEIKGNTNYSEISVKGVENIAPNTPILPDTSLQVITDQLNTSSVNKVDNSNTVVSDTTTVEAMTCEQLVVNISVASATKESYLKFLSALEAYDRRIVCSNLDLSAKSTTELYGNITIEFFALPKVNDADKSYIDWDMTSVKGKGLEFATVASGESNEVKNDFVALLKPPTSEFSTFRMGRANDTTLKSYIYENEQEILDVVLELTEKEGKLFYKYKAGKSSMPTTGTPDGSLFTANGDNIVFKIFSSARDGIDDISGIKLKVINNTTKIVDVIVADDDKSNPRVSTTSEGGKVNVK